MGLIRKKPLVRNIRLCALTMRMANAHSTFVVRSPKDFATGPEKKAVLCLTIYTNTAFVPSSRPVINGVPGILLCGITAACCITLFTIMAIAQELSIACK